MFMCDSCILDPCPKQFSYMRDVDMSYLIEQRYSPVTLDKAHGICQTLMSKPPLKQH